MFNFLFKKQKKYLCGINFGRNLDFQIVEIEQKQKKYFPLFFRSNQKSFLNKNGIFDKEEFILQIKRYKRYIKSNIVKVYLNQDDKVKKQVESSLKIAGFKKVEFIQEKNVLGIVLSNNTAYKKNVIYLSGDKVYCFSVLDDRIDYIDEILLKEFDFAKSVELIQKTNTSNIFFAGEISDKIALLKKITAQLGIRFKIVNIWTNFLNFNDYIPEITPMESQKYIDVFSFLVSDLKERPILLDKRNSEKEIIYLEKPKQKQTIGEVFNNKEKKIEKKNQNKQFLLLSAAKELIKNNNKKQPDESLLKQENHKKVVFKKPIITTIKKKKFNSENKIIYSPKKINFSEQKNEQKIEKTKKKEKKCIKKKKERFSNLNKIIYSPKK